MITSVGNYEKKIQDKGISGSTLKLIGIITMLIDHTAAVVINRIIQLSNGPSPRLESLYYAMRLIGRIAFPIFCFLLIEGFKYTRSHKRYAIRLGVFAFISEIPFNLAFRGKLFAADYQNVFFTLLIGLLMIQGFSLIRKKTGNKKWLAITAVIGAVAAGWMASNILLRFATAISAGEAVIFSLIMCLIMLFLYWKTSKESTEQISNIYFSKLLILVIAMVIADFLNTDYGGFGILTIAVMYTYRQSPVKSMLAACITLTIMSYFQLISFVNVIFIKLYKGKRGLSLKYFFYLFYPVHLLVLYFISYYLQ